MILSFCVCVRLNPHLGGVDSSLLEGAVAGILRAHVAIFAPVTGEVSVNTGQAPGVGENVGQRGENIWDLIFNICNNHLLIIIIIQKKVSCSVSSYP